MYENAPFVDTDGRPKVYQLLCRDPKGGRIVDRYEWQGMELALFEDEPTSQRAWRVLIPDVPIRCAYVKVGPGEGLPEVHDKVTTVTGYLVDWKGHEYKGLKDKDWIDPIIAAGSEMMMRSQWAPTPQEGGYLKTDFLIAWDDETMYQGRFDLQKGGTDGGSSFSESLRHRLFFYGGLYCPPHLTTAQYFQVIDRSLDNFGKTCRHILARCEL